MRSGWAMGTYSRGTWQGIVRQMRDQAGFSHESLPQYMRRLAGALARTARRRDSLCRPEGFLEAAIRVGVVYLED